MNVKFSYLYRDGANYKKFKEIVFGNPENISFEYIKTKIHQSLIGNLWFYAHKWGLQELFFKEYKWDPEIDHTWHEFENIEQSLEPITEKITIKEFIEFIS